MTENDISTNGVGNDVEGAPVSKWGITVLQGEFLTFARLVDGSGAEPAPIYCLVVRLSDHMSRTEPSLLALLSS